MVVVFRNSLIFKRKTLYSYFFEPLLPYIDKVLNNYLLDNSIKDIYPIGGVAERVQK